MHLLKHRERDEADVRSMSFTRRHRGGKQVSTVQDVSADLRSLNGALQPERLWWRALLSDLDGLGGAVCLVLSQAQHGGRGQAGTGVDQFQHSRSRLMWCHRECGNIELAYSLFVLRQWARCPHEAAPITPPGKHRACRTHRQEVIPEVGKSAHLLEPTCMLAHNQLGEGERRSPLQDWQDIHAREALHGAEPHLVLRGDHRCSADCARLHLV